MYVDVPDILNLKHYVYEHVTSALQKVMIEFILHTTDTVHPFPISLPPPSHAQCGKCWDSRDNAQF